MGKAKENNNEFLPVIAIPPGETILESIQAINMSQSELAIRLGVTPKHVSNIIKGIAPITYDTALKLEDVIGPSAEFWMNLETNYQLDKARLEKEKELSVDMELLSQIPYNEFSKLGWVPQTRDKKERVKNCRKLYRVANLGNINKSCAVAFRQGKSVKNISDLGICAWLTKAEEYGEQVEVDSLDRKKIKSLIPEFRKLTLEDPEIFYPKMKKLCSECGIALVLVPSISKTYIYGATIWKGEKAILALSVRGKKADIFWFTFFHELAHLIEHTRKEFHINLDKEQEDEADKKASDYLISEQDYNNFIRKYDYKDCNEIISYSKYIGIHPCILIGRLQHDKLIEHTKTFEKLKPSFSIVK